MKIMKDLRTSGKTEILQSVMNGLISQISMNGSMRIIIQSVMRLWICVEIY